LFGYITANLSSMNDEQRTRYRSWYCGLCRALAQQHGQLSRFTLNYDMTFLVMLLSSIYESNMDSGSQRCLPHPVRPHDYLCSEFSYYAANMNVLLSYHNLMDDWQDDRNLAALSGAKLLKKAGHSVAERYPRQSQAILDGLRALAAAEKNGELRADIPADAFGTIMAELFAVHEDNRADALRKFGRALGRFIYIMDACMDFDSDLRHMRYNPMVSMTKADFEPTLVMLAAECTAAFDTLDVTTDKDIMQNILYSGMWAKYSAKYINKQHKRSKEVSSENE